MLPSGSWLHIAFGLVLGITITVFVIQVANLLKNSTATRKLVGALLLFSLSVAILSFSYGSALSGGFLVEWKSLGFPPEGGATKVLDIGYVQTQSGNIYHFTGLDRKDGKWTEGIWERVDKVTKAPFAVHSPGNCGTFSFLPRNKDHFIDSKSACIGTWRWSTAKVVFAIDNIGHVHLWFHDNAEFGGGDVYWSFFEAFWFSAIERTLFLFGGIGSCIIGLCIVLLLTFSSFLKKKVQQQNLREIQ